MNRHTFLTSLAVTTACTIPVVGALLVRNSFERTLTAAVTKPHRAAIIEQFAANHDDLLRLTTHTYEVVP